jgi:Lrp/AsnC family transcriptional regulator, regulator for asnA, asnC and gidA
MHAEFDDADRAILRELQEDGRRSFRAIARRVGVSEGTVRARVRRLEDAGTLRILAFVDPSRLGDSVLAGVLVRCAAESLDAFTDIVVAMPEVTYASSLLGRADVYIQVICTDNDALWEVVRRVRAITGVRETETLLEMQVHKFTYRDVAGPGGADRSPGGRRKDLGR